MTVLLALPTQSTTRFRARSPMRGLNNHAGGAKSPGGGVGRGLACRLTAGPVAFGSYVEGVEREVEALAQGGPGDTEVPGEVVDHLTMLAARMLGEEALQLASCAVVQGQVGPGVDPARPCRDRPP